jgi:hypothetical protein
MKILKISIALNVLTIGISFLFVFTDSMRAEQLPSKVHSEDMKRIPDGSYLIPANDQNGGTETSVQIVEGEACFVSVIGKNDSKPFQVDFFKRDGIEVITIKKGDERQVIVSKAGEPILPKILTPEQKEEFRAIGLTLKLYMNTLGKNHELYLKE